MLQVRARSEPNADDELLSVVVAKGGRKLVVGSGAGVLNLFSWGHFEDCSDRFPGARVPVAPALAPTASSVTGDYAGVTIQNRYGVPQRRTSCIGCHIDERIGE